jgi:hypothetical protein
MATDTARDTAQENGQETEQEQQRRTVLRFLLAKVAEDTYPSATHLDMIEQLLTDDDLDAYRELLFDKVEKDTYPSNSLLQRLVNLGS